MDWLDLTGGVLPFGMQQTATYTPATAILFFEDSLQRLRDLYL